MEIMDSMYLRLSQTQTQTVAQSTSHAHGLKRIEI